jgi:hypothetical protein
VLEVPLVPGPAVAGCSENNRSTDGSAAYINAQWTKSFYMMSNAALFLAFFDNGYAAFPIGLSGG